MTFFFYLVVHYLAVGYHNRISFKRSLSKQHLICDNTQRPPVTLHSIRSPWPIHTCQDFRGNVLWGSYWHLTVHLKHRKWICCGSIFLFIFWLGGRGLKLFKPVLFLFPFVLDYGNEYPVSRDNFDLPRKKQEEEGRKGPLLTTLTFFDLPLIHRNRWVSPVWNQSYQFYSITHVQS